MNITDLSRDEHLRQIAEMLRSNIKKTKIASNDLLLIHCVSDKTVYKLDYQSGRDV